MLGRLSDELTNDVRCEFMVMKSRKFRTQRKFQFTAPLHIRGHFVHAHLSKELRAKMKKRAVRLKKGDKVRVMRGKFKGKEGKVMSISLSDGKIKIEGVSYRKAKGQEISFPLQPSNVMIIEMVERK